VRREDGRTVIEFPVGGASVVSYSPQAGSPDRHYLAGPAEGTSLPVLPRLRSDASYGDASSAGDGLVAARGGARHVSWHTTPGALVVFSGEAAEAIAGKVRQVLPAPKPQRAEERSASTMQPAAPEAMSPAPEPASGASSVPAAPASPQRGLSGVGKAIGLPAQAMGSVGRVARTYAATGMKALADAVAVTASAGTHWELPRHPGLRVTSGVDSFGTPLNATGGVEVSNDGGAGRPSVTVRGEYDWLLLRDGVSQRRVTPPWSYGELFERLCAAEREHGLFDITTVDGVHVWELGRSALVIQLAEAAGLWGAASAVGGAVDDVYTGSKRLTTAPRARSVVFDYARRGQ